ncbi:MAG: amino acid ABC transporter substrate-binding protein [Thiohalocapsa sp. PB-PSB1]|nr:MAG: amino acid ABC transporter substrate-binding protein [Thiohalocapsa sp. PB-PSB1]
MHSRLLAIGLGLMLSLTSLVHPAAAAEPAIFPDIQRILDAGLIRVAIRAKDAAPMIMTNADGSLTGSEPDLARDLAKKLGVAAEFVRTAETYDGVVELVARKQADIAVSYLSGGMQRARYVFFSRPYIQQSGYFFYNRAQFARIRHDYGVENVRAIEEIANAPELYVGVIGGSVYETKRKRDFPESLLRQFDTLDEMVKAVRAGDIFAAISGGLQVDYYMRSHPATAIYVAIDQDIRQPDDIRIAVRADSPNLLRWINLYLENHVGMLDDAEIVRRYLNRKKEVQ